MAEYVNKIGEGFHPEPYHDSSGFIKPGEKIPMTAELATAKMARSILVPPMEKLLKEKESNTGDH